MGGQGAVKKQLGKGLQEVKNREWRNGWEMKRLQKQGRNEKKKTTKGKKSKKGGDGRMSNGKEEIHWKSI